MLKQKGFVTVLLIILASLGLLFYLVISSAFPFKDKLFSTLYPKPLSRAFSTAAGTPTNLNLTPVSSSQVNLSWKESTDSSTLEGYGVYRNDEKIATVKTTSYGDTGLLPNTTYTYFVVTINKEGQDSLPSNTVSTVTPESLKSVGQIKGTVSSSESILSGVRISININGSNKSFLTDSKGEFSISNLPPGTYSLTLKKFGFEDQSATVNVGSDVTSYVKPLLNKIK